jgi:putative flippase GtrA
VDRTAIDRGARVRRFLRYCVVGGLGTVVHFGVTMLLVEQFRTDAVIATIIGFLCALAVSFALNRTWVFASNVAVAPGLARYTAVSVLGFVLNVAIMAIVTRVLALDYRIGLALVVLIIPVTNFTLNARWTFRH